MNSEENYDCVSDQFCQGYDWFQRNVLQWIFYGRTTFDGKPFFDIDYVRIQADNMMYPYNIYVRNNVCIT